jgi:hypothetical protein
MANFEASSARDLINRFINSIGARDETGVVPFVQAWPRIVGRDKAAHSQVLDVKNGIVLVGVDHPAWLQRLHMDSRRIVEQIRRDFPSLNARTVAFSIVEELTHSWKGESDDPTADDAISEDREVPGSEDSTDTQNGSSDVPSVSSAPSAAEDDSFQKKLADLKRAIEENEDPES